MQQKLEAAFAPIHLLVKNESHTHSVPQGSETHFNLVIVAKIFEGLPRIERQRLVYRALDAELKGGVHALTMRALTPLEWSESGSVDVESPPCYGGSKREKG